MRRQPYESVEVSTSRSGELIPAPANGEAIGIRLNDSYGEYYAYLVEWQNNPDAWISGENNVSLNEKV